MVVTGLGCLTADGGDLETFWSRQLAAQPHITPITRFEAEDLPARHAAQVDDRVLEAEPLEGPFRRADRYTQLAGHVVRAALRHAGLENEGCTPARAGIVIGSGLGGMMFQEEQMWQTIKRGHIRVHPHSVPRVSPTALLSATSSAFGLRGPGHVVASACASGAHAVGQALRLIQHGDADVMIAAGTEAPLTPFSVTAFGLLGVLAPGEGEAPPVCRPFDERRAGFVMGEGAAALVLEAEEHARARGARVLCYVDGYGQSLGGHHPVHVRPDATDATAAMLGALSDADVAPERVGYINAHGTATRDNDRAEARAIHSALGAAAARVPISSSKPMSGHTLGAAGAIEAVVTCLALSRGELPPTAGHKRPDPACELDVIAGQPRRVQAEAALSNAFGFGNVNVSLLFTWSPS